MPSFQNADRAQERRGWKLYILPCQDDHWYVGITSKLVKERFAEHEDKDLKKLGAAATRKWKPIENDVYVQPKWIAEHKDISLPTKQEQDLNYDNRKKDAEELERIVTAQLMLLCGVNRVRGGAFHDLIHDHHYTSSDQDMEMISKNLSQCLCVDLSDVRCHINNMLEEEKLIQFPTYISKSNPPNIFIDHCYNVVVNGNCVQHETLKVIRYEPLDAKMQPRINIHEWKVLFKNQSPVLVHPEAQDYAEPERLEIGDEEGANAGTAISPKRRTYDLRAVSITVFMLALSSIILAIMAYCKPVVKLQDAMGWQFLLISNGVLFAVILTLTCVLYYKESLPTCCGAYFSAILASLFIVLSSVLVSASFKHFLIWRSTGAIRVPTELVVFQTTVSVLAALSGIGVYHVLAREKYNVFVAAIPGVALDAAVVIAFYFLANPTGKINTNETFNLRLPFAVVSGVLSVTCTIVFLFLQHNLDNSSSSIYMTLWYQALFVVPAAFVYILAASLTIMVIGVCIMICASSLNSNEHENGRRARR